MITVFSLLPFCEWQALLQHHEQTWNDFPNVLERYVHLHSCYSGDVSVFHSLSDMIPAVLAAEKQWWAQTEAPVGLPRPLCGSCPFPSLRHHGNYPTRQRLRWWSSQSREVRCHPLHPCPTTGFQQHKQPPGEGVEVFLHDPERGPRPPRAWAQLLPSPPWEPRERGGSSSSHLQWSQTAQGGGGGGQERASGRGGG